MHHNIHKLHNQWQIITCPPESCAYLPCEWSFKFKCLQLKSHLTNFRFKCLHAKSHLFEFQISFVRSCPNEFLWFHDFLPSENVTCNVIIAISIMSLKRPFRAGYFAFCELRPILILSRIIDDGHALWMHIKIDSVEAC